MFLQDDSSCAIVQLLVRVHLCLLLSLSHNHQQILIAAKRTQKKNLLRSLFSWLISVDFSFVLPPNRIAHLAWVLILFSREHREIQLYTCLDFRSRSFVYDLSLGMLFNRKARRRRDEGDVEIVRNACGLRANRSSGHKIKTSARFLWCHQTVLHFTSMMDTPRCLNIERQRVPIWRHNLSCLAVNSRHWSITTELNLAEGKTKPIRREGLRIEKMFSSANTSSRPFYPPQHNPSSSNRLLSWEF